MHICFVITGNIEKWPTAKRATGMAEPLKNLGVEVSIIALDCEANRKRFDYECPNASIYFHSLCSVRKEVAFKKSIIKKIKPDLVYINALGLRTWIHKYNCNLPKSKFVVEHSELFSSISTAKFFKRALAFFYERFSKYLFDGQIAASMYLDDFLKKQLPKEKQDTILYLPYAYNNSILNHKKDFIKSLKSKYQNHKVVLYMGTLILEYGFADLIEAVQIVRKDSKNKLKLLIMGEGRHKKIAEELILDNNLSDTIELLGYVDEEDVGAYFSLADAFVSPLFDTVQDWARCPSKLYMYIPFNKPVITSKVGQAVELFKDDKYFYKNGNVQEFADCIKKALNADDYISGIEINKHNWDNRSFELLKWYNKIFLNLE